FYNHPKLGYCILVNAENSLGRQSFTLAHEFAHALFHYNSRSIISIHKDESPREYFADAFASHFLVPTKEMNKLIDNWDWKNRIDPHKAIELAFSKREAQTLHLNRYPASVLQIVRDLLEREELYVSQAADLLDVSQLQIKSLLMKAPAQATDIEKKEICEFAF
ncbi:MAG: ImmA/IrrE family metallo-endopeptidase, partial [Candidatus Obscuribacterales bacterium]|nr:ImmA/IrrE family metallo-endopeptidase [Candidatus Obscuribacterales bacterium]